MKRLLILIAVTFTACASPPECPEVYPCPEPEVCVCEVCPMPEVKPTPPKMDCDQLIYDLDRMKWRCFDDDDD